MTTYPKRKDMFVKWSKAMVEGSTVDKPNYSPATAKNKRKGAKKRVHSRRKRKKHGSKE